MHKNFKRALCAVMLAGALTAVPFMSGCTSARPEAKITISFLDKEYVLEYTMSRNLYPQTVRHFIELADEEFYDNTIIHNYATSYWYGGGYDYDKDAYAADFADGAMNEYFADHSAEKAYYDLFQANKLTPSVYKEHIDGKFMQPLATLIGEFENAQHKIDNGTGLKSSYGALRMYYTAKDKTCFADDTIPTVWLDKDSQSKDEPLLGSYNLHSATSLFSIQVGSSTTKDSSYCIFATLGNTDVLDDLIDAIAAYKNDTDSTYSGSKFTSTCSNVYVDNYDEYISANVNTASYVVTGEPLVVKSVKITKY